MKKSIALIIVVLLTMTLITSCQGENEESGTGAVSDDGSNFVSNTPEENSNDGPSNESDASTPAETSDNTSTINETSDTISSIDETSIDQSDDEISAQIYAYFDKIDLPENVLTAEDDIIEQYPEEFAAIVAFGEDALPALDKISQFSDFSESKRALAYYAKYNIKPELYDKVIVSPDEKYSVKIGVDSFIGLGSLRGAKYCFEIINNDTGSKKTFTNTFYNNLSAKWSEDSQYIFFNYSEVYDIYAFAYGIQEDGFINTGIVKLESYMKENISDSFEFPLSNIFNIEEIIDGSKLKIKVNLGIGDTAYEGWYLYDFVQDEIVDAEIQKPGE